MCLGLEDSKYLFPSQESEYNILKKALECEFGLYRIKSFYFRESVKTFIIAKLLYPNIRKINNISNIWIILLFYYKKKYKIDWSILSR